MLSTTISHIGVDDLEWIKWWLFVPLYVVSAIGVVFGVYWENDKFPDAKKHRGWRLLLWSLSAEIMLSVLIFATDGWIGKLQKDEILSLEMKLAPRVLTSQQKSLIAEKIQSSFKPAFAFSATNEEEINLAISLSGIFERAGWQWIDWPEDGIRTSLPNRHSVGWVILSGIQIRFFNRQLSDVAKALVDSLTAVGLKNVRIDPADASFQSPTAPMVIEIMIGAKP
jgi:hypothetical protein